MGTPFYPQADSFLYYSNRRSIRVRDSCIGPADYVPDNLAYMYNVSTAKLNYCAVGTHVFNGYLLDILNVQQVPIKRHVYDLYDLHLLRRKGILLKLINTMSF